MNDIERQLIIDNEKTRKAVEKYFRQIVINDTLQAEIFINTGNAVCTVRKAFIRKNNLLCKPVSQFLGGYGTDN